MKKHIWWALFAVFLIIILYFIFKPGVSYTPLTEDTDHIKGNETAEVTIIEYSDFQCPFCEKFWSDTLPQIEEEYITTDKIKFIYRHYPIPNHRFAEKAAEASECAGDQGKFWEYHDKLFANQDALTLDDLRKYSTELNLDQELFDVCLDSGIMKPRVTADYDKGKVDRVGGTPFFKINRDTIEGAYPFSKFKEVIDKEMGE